MDPTKFTPQHLAITLPKGFAVEYRDRSWFDQIYFFKLSMIHEHEGYMPVLYQFDFDQRERPEIPDSLLMTFYYPDIKRVSNLNGIVIIGGRPDIYQSYENTIKLTPQLESLLVEKHNLPKERIQDSIEAQLNQLSDPQGLKPIHTILEKSVSKTGDALNSFFPILGQKAYEIKQLALPTDFALDAVFVFTLNERFFQATQPGEGMETIQLFHHKKASQRVSPQLAYPLVIRWRPIYNDILGQLLNKGHVLPQDYDGYLVPRIIIFQHRESKEYIAMISTITMVEDVSYYHVAVCSSANESGQPLSLLDRQLHREKFGTSSWVKRMDQLNEMQLREFAEDLISTELYEIIATTPLTTDGEFDLGRLHAIKENNE